MMIMPLANRSFVKEENAFWTEVELILRTVFDTNAKIAKDYRRALSKGSLAERTYVLHDDPRNVALELSGIELSDDERIEYFQGANLDRILMERRAEA
jgi:hypothetical protein